MRRVVGLVIAGLLVAGCASTPEPVADSSTTSVAAQAVSPNTNEGVGTSSGASSPTVPASSVPSAVTELSAGPSAVGDTSGGIAADSVAGTATSRPPSPTTAPTATATATAGIVQLLGTLAVKGRAPKTGYDRAQFGPAWTDDVTVADGHNGCDTRNDILRRDLVATTIKADSNGCTVLSGTLHDAYTGKTIAFERGQATSGAVQIDHVVALLDAWQKGAQQLSPTQRQNLANDPLNLQAVDGPTNAQKGAGDAATWLPPNKAYRCMYVSRQVQVKARYHLWVTQAEKDAILRVLATCGAGATSASASAAAASGASRTSSVTSSSAKPKATSPAAKPSGTTTAPITTSPPKLPVTTKAPKTTSPPSPPKAASCHPLSKAGNCYKPGQICAKKDHGTTGIGSSGAAIRCVDDGGTWRWKAA